MNFDSPWLFGSVAIICLAVYLLARLGMKIKINRDGASMSHNGVNEPIPPLIPEKYAREIISLVQRTTNYQAKVTEIKYQTIRSQMRVYEEAEITAASLMRAAFLEITSDLSLDKNTCRKELSAYTVTLSFIFTKIKDFVRSSFQNNHYYLMEDDEFSRYVKEKQLTIVEMVSRELDLLWFSDFVDRDLIRTIKDRKSKEISELITGVYKKAKRIALESKDAIDKEATEYNNYVTQMTGVNPANC